MEAEKDKMIFVDVAANRKQIAEVAGNSIYGNLGSAIKTQTNFAVGGGVLGFIFAVSRRQSWLPYTFAGVLLGVFSGWIVTELKEKQVI